MKVPHSVVGRTRPSSQGLGYLSNSGAQGISDLGRALGGGMAALGGMLQERNQKTEQFTALKSFSDFETSTALALQEMKRGTAPNDGNFFERAGATYDQAAASFLNTLPASQQQQFEVRARELRQRIVLDAMDFQYQQHDAFYRTEVAKEYEKAKAGIDPTLGGSPEQLQPWKARVLELITRTDLSDIEKEKLWADMAVGLEGVAYKTEVKKRVIESGGSAPNLDGTIGGIIDAAAEKYGVSKRAARAIAWLESKGNPNAKNSRSSAGGLFQQVDANAKDYGVANRFDPAQSADGAMRFARDNIASFKRAIGREPSDGELYLMHQQGPAGAIKLLSNPDALAVDVVGYDAVRLNGGAPGMTAQQFANLWIKKAEAAAGAEDLDSDPRFSNLPYEDRLSLRADADREANAYLTEQKAARDADYKQRLNTLLTSIHDGKGGQKAIDDARQSWLVKYDDIHKAQTVLDKKTEDLKFLQLGQELLTNPVSIMNPSDSDHKKAANALFAQRGAAAFQAHDEDYVTNALIPMTQKLRDIPTDAAGMLEGMTRSNNPQRMMYAYNTLAMLQDADPEAFNARINEDLAKRVQYWRDRKDTVPAEELAMGLKGGRDQAERQSRLVLRDEAMKHLTENVNRVPRLQGLVQEVVGEMDIAWTSDPILNSLPWASKGLERDFRVAFVDEYEKRGNFEEAKAAAVKHLQRSWGATMIGGQQTLMKYPPEKVGYHTFNPRRIEEQVRELTGIAPGEKFQLLSDNQTRDEFYDWQRGANEMASYRVIVKGEDGVPREPLDDRGRPLRVSFEKTPEDLIQEELEFEERTLDAEISNAIRDLIHAEAIKMRTGQEVPEEYKERLEELRARKEAAKPVYAPPPQDIFNNATP